jgi:hypothetical protein
VGVFVLGLETFSSTFNIMIRSSHAYSRGKNHALSNISFVTPTNQTL